MKNTFSFLLLLFCLKIGIAQEAPDFTTTDIEGNEHSLYEDYLEQDKVVIIDFFTTWCGPCWFIHGTKALEQAYQVLGPDGQDKIQVFSIESDGSTTIQDLNGTGTNTLGDWVSGISFPIIDENGSNIANSYDVSGVPTIPVICPDKQISSQLYPVANGGNFTFEHVYESVYACLPAPDLEKNVIALTFAGDKKSCGTVDGDLLFHNYSKNDVKSLDYSIYRNDELIKTENWTGDIKSNKVFRIPLTGISTDPSGANSNFKIIIENDDDNSDNEILFSVSSEVPQTNNAINIEWQLDEYANGDNTKLIIYDGAANVIEEVSNFTNSSLYSNTFNLELGCYSIQLFDDFGDGAGSIKITDGAGFELLNEEVLLFSKYKIPFEVNSVSSVIPSPMDTEVAISPNLTHDLSKINIELQESIPNCKIELFNLVGEKVSSIYTGQMNSGKSSYQADISGLPNGQYIVQINLNGSIITKKLIKI